ncbi:DUF6314 family protein [Oceaniglobus trochenteri]|uniref:DUF6314 family protein n=1 Tax=Oceaniglobus trochenteri TaxID=2763260 RepID=UPI001CFFB65A|nr:DUF6314 family protein [Oceaniglobus trochenteri]
MLGKTITLADFTGSWTLTRQIDDSRNATRANLEGLARFIGDGAGLRYDEAGTLRLPGQAPVQARRRYHWRAESGAIVVFFEDGRPFHRFDPADSAPGDTHLCTPDTYVVRYDFSRWPRWTSHWQVNGPRKAYAMTSLYEPCDTAFAGAETAERTLSEGP